MLGFYQKEWQNIKFENFSSGPSDSLADARFYDDFYDIFFTKYQSYSELDEDWRNKKDQIADWITQLIQKKSRVLSVGCGIGYIEQQLWLKHADYVDLYVQDYSSNASQWLRKIMPLERFEFVDSADKILEADRKFDIIYLSAVDYALTNDDLISLLSSLNTRLEKNGYILMISASYLDMSRASIVKYKAKNFIKYILSKIHLYNRGQFWGYIRSREEYRAILIKSGLSFISDGFIKTELQSTYWIKAYESKIE